MVGHIGLLALLIYAAQGSESPASDMPAAIEVSLSDNIGMTSAAPDPGKEPPAQQKGEDPTKPADSEIAPPEEEPDPVKKPDPPKPAAKPDLSDRRRPDQPSSSQSTRRNVTPSRDFLNGGGNFDGPAKPPSQGPGEKSPAAATGEERASFTDAVKRAVQPCANRQNIPAAEAEQIVAIVQLKLNRDGSLASIQILRHEGVNAANQRYLTRVDDAVEAIFKGCTPIRNLPAKLYDVKGGWKSLTFKYQMGN